MCWACIKELCGRFLKLRDIAGAFMMMRKMILLKRKDVVFMEFWLMIHPILIKM